MSYVVQTSQCKRTWWALHDPLLKHNWPLILVASSYDLSIFVSGRNGNTHDFFWVKLCGNRSLDYVLSTDWLIIIFLKCIHGSSFLYFTFFNIALFKYIFWYFFPLTFTCKPVFRRGTPENSISKWQCCIVDLLFCWHQKSQRYVQVQTQNTTAR